jgi:hypothetical protein
MRSRSSRFRFWMPIHCTKRPTDLAGTGCMWGVDRCPNRSTVKNARGHRRQQRNVSLAFTDESGIYYIDAKTAPALGESEITVGCLPRVARRKASSTTLRTRTRRWRP